MMNPTEPDGRVEAELAGVTRKRRMAGAGAELLSAAEELNDLAVMQVARHELRSERLAAAWARGSLHPPGGGILRQAALAGYTRAGGGLGWPRGRVLL